MTDQYAQYADTLLDTESGQALLQETVSGLAESLHIDAEEAADTFREYLEDPENFDRAARHTASAGLEMTRLDASGSIPVLVTLLPVIVQITTLVMTALYQKLLDEGISIGLEFLKAWVLDRKKQSCVMVIWPDSRRTLHAIPGETFRIGRLAGENDLAVPGSYKSVAGLHAEIRVQRKDSRIIDLNTSQGTWLNGRRIEGVTLLHHGDVIALGNEGEAIQIRFLEHRKDASLSLGKKQLEQIKRDISRLCWKYRIEAKAQEQIELLMLDHLT